MKSGRGVLFGSDHTPLLLPLSLSHLPRTEGNVLILVLHLMVLLLLVGRVDDEFVDGGGH